MFVVTIFSPTSIVGTIRTNCREIPIWKANLNIQESEFFETTMEKGNVANVVRYQTKPNQEAHQLLGQSKRRQLKFDPKPSEAAFWTDLSLELP